MAQSGCGAPRSERLWREGAALDVLQERRKGQRLGDSAVQAERLRAESAGDQV